MAERVRSATNKRVINLDKARAARLEASGAEPVYLVVSGKELELPAELPLKALEAFGEVLAMQGAWDAEGEVVDADAARNAMGAIPPALEALLGAKAWAAIGDTLSLDDVEFLFEEVLGAYGLEAPPSPALPASS